MLILQYVLLKNTTYIVSIAVHNARNTRTVETSVQASLYGVEYAISVAIIVTAIIQLRPFQRMYHLHHTPFLMDSFRGNWLSMGTQ